MGFKEISNKEDGFVLVVALMIMVILSLIGIAGLNTSMFEEQIAGNDWNARRSFYKADGGITTGAELLEQNFNCPTGFQKTDPIDGTILINNNTLASNSPMSADTIKAKLNAPVVNYDAAYPSATNNGLPTQDVGYLYFGGQTLVLAGGALQMAAGYEGKGKSAAQGGVAKLVNIYSQFLGPRSSEAIILSGWRHLIGTEGKCIY